jgi:hypothetical protein
MKVTKNRKTIRKIVDECSVVYDNGVWCEYEKTNYKLTKVQFFSPTEKRLYYLDNTAKEKLSNTHWNEHYLIIKEHQIKITEKEILNFTNFEQLFYIGGGYDGMVRDYLDKPITSIILLDEVFFQIYEEIETSKKECEKILNSLNKEYIKWSQIQEIGWYNQNEKCDEHYTLSIKCLLPQEVYEKILGNGNMFDEKKREVVLWLFGIL